MAVLDFLRQLRGVNTPYLGAYTAVEIALINAAIASGGYAPALGSHLVNSDTGIKYDLRGVGTAAAMVDGGGSAFDIPLPVNPLLANFRLKASLVRAGLLARLPVLLLSDSKGVGAYANYPASSGFDGARPFSPIVQLTDLFSRYVTPNVRNDSLLGFGALTGSGYALYDTRWSMPGWSRNALDFMIGGGLTGVAGGLASFTPSTPWDTVKIPYAQNSAQGAFYVSINGGAETFVQANNATAALASLTLNAGSLGLNTLNLRKFNGSANNIAGLIFSNSTKSEIDIINGSASGKKAVDIGTGVQPWDAINEILFIAPVLTIIDMGTNDWNNASKTPIGDATTAGTYIYYIQQAITAAKVSGDVLLVGPVPSAVSSGGLATLAEQKAYVDALKALAAANSIGFTSNFDRFVSKELAAAFYGDNLHLYKSGGLEAVRGYMQGIGGY